MVVVMMDDEGKRSEGETCSEQDVGVGCMSDVVIRRVRLHVIVELLLFRVAPFLKFDHLHIFKNSVLQRKYARNVL